MKNIFDRVFRDKDDHIVIWQMPNVPLWIWIVSVVTGFLVHGTLKTVVSAIGSLALVVWAVMEIGWGVSLFRRLVGAVVLVTILTGGAMRLLR